MKILVIGCGSVGERHIKNLKSLDLEEIVACDQSRERLEYIKDKYAIKVFKDYKQAFADNATDAVLVCTPTSDHIAPALAAIRQGCHVFIEKPISHTLEGVDNLINEANRKKLALMMGFNYRFHPGLQQVKRILDGKIIGRLIGARAYFGSFFLYRVPFHSGKDYRQDYAAKKIGGGVILDAATHMIDYLCWFLGEVEEVFCYSVKISSLDLEAEDFAEMILKFKGGAVASLHADFLQQPYQNKLEILGEVGIISWNYNGGKVMLSQTIPDQWQEMEVENRDRDMYLEEMRHFIMCVKGEDKPAVDGTAGKHVLEIALAARESSAKGRIIKV